MSPCIQVLSYLVLISLSVDLMGGLQETAQAGEQCFDFTKEITQLLKPLNTLSGPSGEEISSKSGMLNENITWAVSRGLVKRPIQSLLTELEDHQSTRSKRIDKMTVTALKDPHFLMRQDVESKVYPFPLITISWIEQWGFSLLQGTEQEPQEVLASYQKSEGTSHIEHLCGNIDLRKVSADVTDVFIYEEAKATGRSQSDTENGIQGTIKTLRASNSTPSHSP